MSVPYYSDDLVTLLVGDCLDVLREVPDCSVDSVCTDPPYGLAELSADVVLAAIAAWMGGDRTHVPVGRGFMGREWDRFVPPPGAWDECMRVLKPGGHLLSFAGSRTVDLMTLSIRIAGFEIRDTINWIYGSGYPKSLSVSKAIDKQARGAMVRARLLHFAAERGIDGRWLEARGIASASSFADWTTGGHVPSDQNWQIVKGALEVTDAEEAAFDRLVVARGKGKGSRSTIGPVGVGEADYDITTAATADAARWEGWGTALKPAHEPIVVARKPLAGTVAANVTTYSTGALNIAGCRVPANGGISGRVNPDIRAGNYGSGGGRGRDASSYEPDDAGRWPPNVLLGDEAAAELDRQSGVLTSGANPARRSSDKFGDAYGEFAGRQECIAHRGADAGGASRFFPVFRYEAKAPASERPRLADGTAHTTVKPVELMRWLVRLVTPPGGLVLDPFAGSGTTAEACVIEGFRCILAEKEPAHAELIKARLSKPIQPDLFGGAA